MLRLAASLALSAFAVPSADAQAPSKPSLAEPSLSPDGAAIAFVSGGAIWTVPAGGGQARILVSDQASDDNPLFSPDGTQLAFTSTRAGQSNVYVLTLATGQVRRLTYADVNEQLNGWSRDGRWLYFSSPVNDISRQNDIFRVSIEGGTPLEVSRERYLNEFQAAPSPDGQSIALMAKGISSTQWWRNGHAHIDEAELWLKPIAGEGGYKRLLGPDAKHLWPMWSADGRALYYMSDRSGSENLWRLSLDGGEPQQVTHLTDGRVLWPTIGWDGKSIVFERGFAIWKLDIGAGQAAEVPIQLVGAVPSPGVRHLTETKFNELALSPDGKKAALIAHGEVFAVGAKDGGPAQRVTHTPQAEREMVWSPDSRLAFYISEDGVGGRLMAYDFGAQAEHVVATSAQQDIAAPSVSPDGKLLAYVRNDKEVHVVALGPKGEAGKDAIVYTGAVAGFGGDRLSWAPDSRCSPSSSPISAHSAT
jgi:Tol biopolymer transport system component